MPITVAMIEEKEFKIKLKGYDQVEVDEFLDQVCDEMVAMQEEIATLQARLSQAPRAAQPFAPVPPPASIPAPAPAPVPAPMPEPAMEQPAPAAKAAPAEEPSAAAQKLLARAQKVYDETIAEAQAEAEKILSGATARADSGILALEEEKAALEKEVEILKAAAKDYRARFMRLVEDQQHVLNAENELFE